MSASKASRRLKWAARIVGTITAATWAISLLLSVIAERGAPILLEGILLAVIAFSNIAAVIISWWFPGIGGVLLIVFGTAFGTFGYITAGHNKYFAAFISGFPFLVTGILFILSWRRSRVK